jgi:hypothetical protein
MLSSLPKLADKAFILGFFVPTLLFVTAVTALFPEQDWAKGFLSAATEKDGWDKFAYFILMVWVLSIFLMMFNLVELQILEGYRWPISKISHFKRMEESRCNVRNAPFAALDRAWQAAGDAFPADQRDEWGNLRYQLVREFPVDPAEQLPTRLGNAIRAFESYPREVYGADSIPLWLHLSAVIPEGFQSAIDDARAQVNCAINISVLAAIIAPIAAVQFLCSLYWDSFFSAFNSYQGLVAMATKFGVPSLLFLLATVAALLICRAAYLFAVELAMAWGDLVKAAFDCFLPALAEKLGYKLPDTADERKKFWVAVSGQALFWTQVLPEQWKPAEKKEPANAQAHNANEIKRLLGALLRRN